MNYVLPVCRSSFSLLYGTTPPEELVQAAVENNYTALLMADFNNLYGCYDFYYAALETGLKSIIGADVTTHLGNILFICENHDGFRNLSRIITHYQLYGALPIETIAQYNDSLFCVTANESSLENLKNIFDRRLYIKIGYKQPSRMIRTAAKHNIKPLACPDVSSLHENEFEKHRLLRAIEGGYLLNNLPTDETAEKQSWLRSPEWYNKFYTSFPEAVNNSRELIDRCNLIFPERKNILPQIEVNGDHYEKLKNDALNGLHRKLKNPSGHYLSRLEYEISVIQRTGYVDYFLIVGEIIDYCQRENIAAIGRGSAAGSLVSYSLGITQVDPIRQKLYFERFLNEARSDCPDIDLDIDWRRRDDVLTFIYKKYGDDHVAMMATYTRFRPRLAIRETAKAMGLPPEEIEYFTKRLSGHPLERNDFPRFSSNSLKATGERFKPILQAARSICGLPRHLGIHSGGIVITPGPLTDYIPLEKTTKGIVVTQCDMYQAEKIGLVKIDILGQRGLGVLVDCYNAVKQVEGEYFTVPEHDSKTYDILRTGKTIGVFQIESPGMRALLRDLCPQKLDDITLGLALIRPGASESGMKKIFLDRFHGNEKTVYPHQNLKTVLNDTFGVFIYQEQVILAAKEIAGFNLPASDLLRRAITKKRKQIDLDKLRRRFLDGARNNNVDSATAENILNQLAQFASFGFCKAHAATYGYLAWQSAYFKAHYPDIFMTAVLRNGGGYYPSAVYVAEARRLGVMIRPPDVNRSDKIDSTYEGNIYLGLHRIRDLTHKTIDNIQNNRPFVSLSDFLSKVELSAREIENLIRVGFFDSIDSSRPKLLWLYRLGFGKGSRSKNDLFGEKIISPPLEQMPHLEQFTRYEIFRAEKDILELPASFHPLSLFENYQKCNLEKIIRKKQGAPITISGWLADRKRIKTREGKAMVFLTFDSPDDTFEVVLFPEIYNRFSGLIRKYRYLTVRGHVNVEGGNTAVIANEIFAAPTGLKETRYI